MYPMKVSPKQGSIRLNIFQNTNYTLYYTKYTPRPWYSRILFTETLIQSLLRFLPFENIKVYFDVNVILTSTKTLTELVDVDVKMIIWMDSSNITLLTSTRYPKEKYVDALISDLCFFFVGSMSPFSTKMVFTVFGVKKGKKLLTAAWSAKRINFTRAIKSFKGERVEALG